MKIAILGTGPIGSTFALHLARSGHDVTAIARGKRLAELEADRAIVTVSGERAAVKVSGALDPALELDLVLVTVLASQLDVVLPALKKSAARTVMFMFNTFESLDPLRDAVGEARFAFGFPGIVASLSEGKLKLKVLERGQITITTDPAWAKTFTEAGILTGVENDMQSWLRTHAVVIAGGMAVASLAHSRDAGVSWAEAKNHALAMHEGFALVRRLGHPITPPAIATLSRAPTSVLTSLLWAASRLGPVRDVGAAGPSEPRTLIDAMLRVAPPEACSKLNEIRKAP